MAGNFAIRRAAETLMAGGVIAYPTEGVFGLGCLAADTDAILRLLDIKERDPAKGLILIVAAAADLAGWVAPSALAALPPPEPGHPVTWLVPPGPRATPLIRGAHDNVAVRITTNSVARAICAEVRAPVTSTSANLSGRPVVRNRYTLERRFRRLVDYIVPGDCGPASGPSEIRHLESGRVLRAKAT